MPRKSDKEEEQAVLEDVPEPEPEPVVTEPAPPTAAVAVTEAEPAGRHHGRFTVRTISASSESGKGYIVFDTVEQHMVDAPFRDREDAVARAAKREIRG